MSLCLHPLKGVADAAIVVLHTLMIAVNEETYLQMANQLTPLCSGDGDD